MSRVYDDVAQDGAWEQLAELMVLPFDDFDDTAGFAIGDFTGEGKDNITVANQALDSLLVFGNVNGTTVRVKKTGA